MWQSCVVVFREVFEAALVIGIILAATTGLPHRNRWIALGIFCGVIGSTLVAAFAGAIAEAASGVGQELFNASILFVAVVVLGWSVVWMRSHGREMAMKAKEVGQNIADGELPIHMLSIVVGLAVLREGSEAVLFLFGIAAQGSTAYSVLFGALLGIAAGAAVGYVMYRGLVSIPVKHLFGVISWLLVLLAAGMASQGANFLVAANVLPALGTSIWDTSHIISERTLFGQFLHTLIGYTARPEGIQIVFYVATLFVVGGAMYLSGRRQANAKKSISKKAAGAGAATAALLVLLPQTGHAIASKVYSPTVHYGEISIETRGFNGFDKSPARDGEMTLLNEVEAGVTDYWQTGLFGELQRDPGGDLNYTATGWENIFQFFEPGEAWMDSGLYLEYESGYGKQPDAVETKLLLEKPVGRFVNTLNVIFEKQIGNNAQGTSMGYAYRTMYRWKPYLQPAVEVFGDMGRVSNLPAVSQQEHKLGPVVVGTVPLAQSLSFYYEAGWLFGLTDATAKNTIKWLGELEFYF